MSAPRPPQSGGAMMGIGGCVCVRTTDKRPTHRVQSSPAPLDSGRPSGPFSAIATLKFGASTIAPVTVRQHQRVMVWRGGSQIVMFLRCRYPQAGRSSAGLRTIFRARPLWLCHRAQPRTVSGGHVTGKGEQISRTLPLRRGFLKELLNKTRSRRAKPCPHRRAAIAARIDARAVN